MYIDIDKRYAVNLLFNIFKRFPTAEIRETEHGYHIKIDEIKCSPDNFIFCLVLRLQLGDDKGRIGMDILRLSLIDEENIEEFPIYFDVVFDIKVKEKKVKVKGKWYKLQEYLALRGILST